MGRTIGIDLGTTNSAMAVLEGGEPVIVANAEGKRTTPSVVAFTKKGETIVGDVAYRQAVTNANRTFKSAKRQMGTDWKSDDIDGKQYRAEEIGARVLMKLKEDAEAYLGEDVTNAIITVPAYFNDSERQATKNAGDIAGLTVDRVINEPTAAALAYGLDKESDQIILVYDLGGGTFDVSLLEIGDGYIEVKSTTGDNKLGGDDWDGALADWIVQSFKDESGQDISNDFAAMSRVREAAENAKKELSSTDQTNISLPYLAVDEGTPVSFEAELSRAEFEDLTRDLLERTRGPVETVLKDAEVDVKDVNQVILVGGSTRMPAINDLVKDLTGKDPNRTVNPDEVVALGACLQGGIKTGEVKEMVLIDVTSLTLGVSASGGMMVPLIEKGTAMPCRGTKTFTTAEDSQNNVNVEVYQGERALAKDNKKLGQFELSNIPPAPAGVPQIEVVFDIDVNGILNVTAKDHASGTTQKVTVTGSTGLGDAEVQSAMADAAAHAEEDKRLKEEVSLKNRARTLISQSERLVKEHGDKPGEDKRKALEEAVGRLKGKLDNSSIEELTKDTDALSDASQAYGAGLYSSS